MTLPDGYELVPGVPELDDYLRLRLEAGLTPRSPEAVRLALKGSWAACHVVHRDPADPARVETVGMGRLIGDGGWYFHVVDMAVLPTHQRRGIGDAVLSWLVGRISELAPPGAYVSLMADPPGRRLYERHGFTDGRSVGMAMVLPE